MGRSRAKRKPSSDGGRAGESPAGTSAAPAASTEERRRASTRALRIRVGAAALQLLIISALYLHVRRGGGQRALGVDAVSVGTNADNALALVERLEIIIVEEHVKQLAELEREQSAALASMEERHAAKLVKVVKRYKANAGTRRAAPASEGATNASVGSSQSSVGRRIAHLKQRLASMPNDAATGPGSAAAASGSPKLCMACIECVKEGRTFDASTLQCVAGKGKWWTELCLPDDRLCPGYKGRLASELSTLVALQKENKGMVKAKSKSLASSALGFPFDIFSEWGWNQRVISRYLDYSPDLCCRLLPRMNFNAPSICCQAQLYKATPQRWSKMKPPLSPPPYPGGVLELVTRHLQGKTLHVIGDSMSTQLCNHLGCALRATGLPLEPFIVERQQSGGGGEQVVFARFGIPSLNAEVWCSELHAVYENARNTANFKKMLSLSAKAIATSGRVPVIALNVGLHVHDAERLDFELAGITKELAAFVAEHPKAIALLRETSPQHFPTSDGSGLFEMKVGGKCAASERNQGNWRNELLKAAAEKSGLGADHVIEIHDDMQPWWDAHAGQWAKDDCECDSADPACDCACRCSTAAWRCASAFDARRSTLTPPPPLPLSSC
jgi:hypothetical protein